MHPRDNRIPIAQCEDRKVYRVWARNIKIGVYLKGKREFNGSDWFGFYGIREKFGSRFIDSENHWDAPDFATCCPIEVICDLPSDINITEGEGSEELFKWLDAKEQELGLTDQVWGEWKMKLFQDELASRKKDKQP
jgi:hypothetical protein